MTNRNTLKLLIIAIGAIIAVFEFNYSPRTLYAVDAPVEINVYDSDNNYSLHFPSMESSSYKIPTNLNARIVGEEIVIRKECLIGINDFYILMKDKDDKEHTVNLKNTIQITLNARGYIKSLLKFIL